VDGGREEDATGCRQAAPAGSPRSSARLMLPDEAGRALGLAESARLRE
jgi:hypothetical protein